MLLFMALIGLELIKIYKSSFLSLLMAKILVTGGAGFIGSHVTDYLIERGHEVTVLDDLSGGLERNLNPNAEFIRGSITDQATVERAVSGKDIVYHLAAYAAEGLSHFIRRFNYNNNLIGSTNLLNSAIRNGVKRFVFTSSIAVYGKGSNKLPFREEEAPSPEDPYGIAKYAFELDLKAAHEMFGLDYTVLRPFNVYGERQSLGDPYRNVIGIFMNSIMQGKPLPVYGDGEQTRAFTYIGDIAPCIAESAFNENARNEVINLGARKFYTVNQLTDAVKKAMSSDSEIVHLPPRNEVKDAYALVDKAERTLGFEDKVKLEEGLRRMAEWAKSVGPMEPIIWENLELTEKLPEKWRNLPRDHPNAKKRISASF